MLTHAIFFLFIYLFQAAPSFSKKQPPFWAPVYPAGYGVQCRMLSGSYVYCVCVRVRVRVCMYNVNISQLKFSKTATLKTYHITVYMPTEGLKYLWNEEKTFKLRRCSQNHSLASFNVIWSFPSWQLRFIKNQTLMCL